LRQGAQQENCPESRQNTSQEDYRGIHVTCAHFSVTFTPLPTCGPFSQKTPTVLMTHIQMKTNGGKIYEFSKLHKFKESPRR
jgi:hypothetical protein